MTELFRRRVVLAKIETVYGTDSVPTGAANAILVSEPVVTPLEGSYVDRNLLFPELGASPELLVGKHVSCTFMVEIAGGGGAVDAPPAYGPLLRACAMAETVNALVDVQYDPVSTGEESASIYFHVAGTRHRLLGARGNVRVVLDTTGVPHYEFEFRGLYAAPTAQTIPTPIFTGFAAPLPVSNANTPTFTLDAFAAVLQSINLDLGNAIVHRDLVNSATVERTDRQGSGSLVIETPAIGTKDFFAIAGAGSQVALQLVHGTVAGNIVQIDAPKAQLRNPTYSDGDGKAMLNMDLTLTRNAGDDEVKITVR